MKAMIKPFVTNNYLQYLEKLLIGYPDGATFNPILCAQDIPDDMTSAKFSTSMISDNFSIVEVSLFPVSGNFSVEIIKNDNSAGWMIDKISCKK
jgi:hypothetical protein